MGSYRKSTSLTNLDLTLRRSPPRPRRLVRMLTLGIALSGTLSLLGCGEPPSPPGPGPDDDDVPPLEDCDPSIGATAPLAVCAPEAPCVALPSSDDRDVIDAASEVPLCATSNADRPPFDDGPALQWTDLDGVVRSSCLFVPDGAGPASPRPLVVFLHGAFGSADNLYDATSLRSKAPQFNLSDDPARPGFALLSVQGRNLHWPTSDPRDGAHHDNFHRDLGAPSANPDVANLDRLIDDLVADGAVDPARIYVTGWSNGGFFAQMYAIARHETPTPGGNTVAAATVFSAADPFHGARHGEEPSCRLETYPPSEVPIFVVGRACDLVACDADQAEDLVEDEVPIAPGFVAATWMDDLAGRVGDPNAERRIVNGWGDAVDECTGPALCGPAVATLGHLRWPDGVADGSGNDHEADMLQFLREAP